LQETAPFSFGYLGFSPTPDPVGNPDNLLSRLNFAHDSTVNNVLVDNQIEGKLRAGPIEHRLLFGADYKWYELDQVQASSIGTPISATDPVYGAPQPAPVPYLDEVITLQQLGFYAQDQLRFADGWIVTLGGRYDRVNIESDSRLPTIADYENDEDAWSGRAGIAYQFKNGFTPYASVSTFFNPLIGTNAGEPLVPESGEQYEVGVKYAPTWFDGIITVAWFDLTKQNVLVGNAVNFSQEQIGEVNSRGFEFEAKANLTRDIKLTAFFTIFDLEITEHGNPALIGNTPFLIPETQAGIFLDYTFHGGALEGITIGGGVRYNGESWADNENTLKVPDVALFDAKIGYARDNWGIALNVNNIFDEEYVSGCQGVFTCSYGEGRVVKLKTHMTW
jgi:iron complex outermembrane receptor protein